MKLWSHSAGFLLLLSLLTLAPAGARAKSAHKKKPAAHKSAASKTALHKTVAYKTTSSRKTAHGSHKSDPEARILVRRRAPFYMEERARGFTVRINKDGTFSREGRPGAYGSEGHWKISSGRLKLKWATGEEHTYRVAFSGATPLIAGHKANKSGRYVIKSSDKP
jgi:hypothetical protein